jgi:hypothetical protein
MTDKKTIKDGLVPIHKCCTIKVEILNKRIRVFTNISVLSVNLYNIFDIVLKFLKKMRF